MFVIDENTLGAKQFDIEIIAGSLANQCRWAGHTKTWFSVAEHCILVSDLIGNSLAGLLHDASEFVFGDIPGPIKHQFPNLVGIEKRFQKRIYDYFEVPNPGRLRVAEADRRAREIELEHYVKRHKSNAWSPDEAKWEFLFRFQQLRVT